MRNALPLPDLDNVFNNTTHDIVWLVFGMGIDYLRRNREKIFKLKNIRKNFGWFSILCHILSLVITANFEYIFRRLHLHPLAKICIKIIQNDLTSGYRTLCKIEPNLAQTIAEVITKIANEYKVYKLTGVKSAFLQKYLPDVTP
jgi:hypothetical protein